ncbi:hypothetical protein DBV15_04268 [Temnothorax longispinosus]|uniref:Uncharacterized protein n=1 Tax=Temnothorax longispinosus TaxID=300112 RepID=A0A4S2KTJ0_9HYME|nr:hypothetical protein DBV15_04268 [Temnothorax longispinosus]
MTQIETVEGALPRKTGFMVHGLLSMHGDCSSCLESERDNESRYLWHQKTYHHRAARYSERFYQQGDVLQCKISNGALTEHDTQRDNYQGQLR